MSKLIPLTRGFFATVDNSDFEKLSKYKWCLLVSTQGIYYAARYFNRAGRKGGVMMHREIMGFPPGLFVDHIDGNGLNNQRQNLRRATSRQNLANQKPSKGRRFKGVYPKVGKKRTTWNVRAFGKYIGTFQTEEEAARAYDAAAVRVAGEFARKNLPEENFCI